MFKFSKKSSKKFKSEESRVQYNEESSNGLIIEETYIPEELLCEILCYFDHKTLLVCQLVCKRWQFLIQDFVWHKKAEISLGRSIPINQNVTWPLYYFICAKTRFDKNLVKNHSGELGLNFHWNIIANGGDGWKVESPPVGVPALPNDPVFKGINSCFVTSYYLNRRADMDNYSCRKYQVIDLINEGFTKYLLDNLQPKIKISEWISCRSESPAVYSCFLQLLSEKKKKGRKEKILDNIKMTRLLIDDNQNKWIKYEYEFENYGKGLRKIKFFHSGQDDQLRRGHFGSKMAGASVIIENPIFRWM